MIVPKGTFVPIPRASGFVLALPRILMALADYARHGSPHPKWSVKGLLVVAMLKNFFAGRWVPKNDQSVMTDRLDLEFDVNVSVRRELVEPLESHYYEPGLSHPKVSPTQVPAFFLTPTRTRVGSAVKDDNTIVLYFHGGGYQFGNATAAGLASLVANKLAREVCSIDYRLGDTQPFPAAVQDCITVYFHLRKTRRADQIIIAGDSAGGGLALATLLHLRHFDERPLKGILISPFMQTVNYEGDSYKRYARTDLISVPELRQVTEGYTSLDPSSKYIQLLQNTYENLPPLFVIYGSAEIFHDDVQEFVGRARNDGVQVDEFVGDGKSHVWIALPWDKKDVSLAWKAMRVFVDGQQRSVL